MLGSLGRQIPPQHARPPPSYPRPATNDSTQRSTLARTPGNNLTRSRSTSQQRYCQVVHRPTSAHVSYKRSTQVHTAPYRTRRQNTAPSPLPLCPKGFNFTPRSSSYSPRKDVPPFPISTYKPQNNFVPLSSIYMSHDLTLPAVSHSKSPINNSTSTLQPPVRYSTSFDFGSAQVPASTANAQDTTGSFGSLWTWQERHSNSSIFHNRCSHFTRHWSYTEQSKSDLSRIRSFLIL